MVFKFDRVSREKNSYLLQLDEGNIAVEGRDVQVTVNLATHFGEKRIKCYHLELLRKVDADSKS